MTKRTSGLSRRSFVGASGALGLAGIVGLPRIAVAADDYKIGAVASLTGPAAAFGKDWAEGFTAYVKAWNAAGGYKGRKIVIDILDDETNQVSAVNAFRKLAGTADVNIIWVALASQ